MEKIETGTKVKLKYPLKIGYTNPDRNIEIYDLEAGMFIGEVLANRMERNFKGGERRSKREDELVELPNPKIYLPFNLPIFDIENVYYEDPLKGAFEITKLLDGTVYVRMNGKSEEYEYISSRFSGGRNGTYVLIPKEGEPIIQTCKKRTQFEIAAFLNSFSGKVYEDLELTIAYYVVKFKKENKSERIYFPPQVALYKFNEEDPDPKFRYYAACVFPKSHTTVLIPVNLLKPCVD